MPAPGTVKPRRYLPRFHWELLACGVSGHRLVGIGAAELRAEDALIAREMDGVRWHRCLRCDSWLPFEPPEHPESRYSPDRAEVELPLRGRPLRDKIVLRVIAIDRGFHFLVLALLAVAIFLFAANQRALRDTFYSVVTDIQQGFGGGPVHEQQTGFLHELDKVLSLQGGQLHLLGAAVGAYAILELVEAVGLWRGRRWAEYLTFIATAVFLPLEVYELTKSISVVKILAFVVNVAIVIYLLYAKRLFGLRGGGKAEEALRERDVGWEALERSAPPEMKVTQASSS
jgi:uncharacterized membrane protein (DUF2068 family)